MRNCYCFRDGTCHSSIGLVTLKPGLRPSLILKETTHCVWTWMLGHWTCHSSIGLVILKLGLRPSFILNEKLLLFLNLDVGRWDLSLQHWTCHLEAGPSAFGPASFLRRNCVCFWTWMLGDGTCQSSIGLVTLKLSLRPSSQLHS